LSIPTYKFGVNTFFCLFSFGLASDAGGGNNPSLRRTLRRCDHARMPNKQHEEFAKLCEEVLVPQIEEVVRRRVKNLQETLEILARGVHEVHERLDEQER